MARKNQVEKRAIAEAIELLDNSKIRSVLRCRLIELLFRHDSQTKELRENERQRKHDLALARLKVERTSAPEPKPKVNQDAQSLGVDMDAETKVLTPIEALREVVDDEGRPAEERKAAAENIQKLKLRDVIEKVLNEGRTEAQRT